MTARESKVPEAKEMGFRSKCIPVEYLDFLLASPVLILTHSGRQFQYASALLDTNETKRVMSHDRCQHT